MPRPTVTSERIDDVPLLIYWLRQMHIDTIIDAVLGPPHGNWQGLSYGQLALLFVAYILTECNHFLSGLQDWVNERRDCLSLALGCPIRPTDCTDDRLEVLLDELGNHEENVGEQIEVQLGQHLIRAYDLPTDTARIDTTSVSVYHQPETEGLLAFGKSKEHRPDLRQFVEVLGTLDPMGMPLGSATVAGESADDPLYLPTWRQMAKTLGRTDFLAVGDCKLASLENRATIQDEGGYYLAPLPMTGNTPKLLRQLVMQPPHPFQTIRLPDQSDPEPGVGLGLEIAKQRNWRHPKSKRLILWTERVLLLRSDKLAARQQRGLQQRLSRTEAALQALHLKPELSLAEREARVQAILNQRQVGDYLVARWVAQTSQEKRYLKRGRHGPDSPFETVEVTTWSLQMERQAEAIAEFDQLAGWRLFVTNAPKQRLTLSQAVACYREEWQPERGFHRLKGVPLAVRPLLLRTDRRIRGLLLVLVIALRALTLFEFVIRRNLGAQTEPLRGLYAGNPQRATKQPTTERLLTAFDNLTLYRLSVGEEVWYEMTPLSALQKRILALAGVPETVYTDLLSLSLPGP